MSKEGIKKIFEARENFVILGVTGRTGSGCSSLSNILSKEIEQINFPEPELELDSSNKRRYRIAYNYVLKNWQTFYWIKVKDVIASYILEHDLDDILKYIQNHFQARHPINVKEDFKNKYISFQELNFNVNEILYKVQNLQKIDITEIVAVYDFYFKKINELTEELKRILNYSLIENINYSSVFQLFGDNIRSSGSILDSKFNAAKLYSISEKINQIIKFIRKKASIDNKKAYIVIDAFRNPLEVHFFRERYSAFYLISVNTDHESRIKRLRTQLDYKDSEIFKLDRKEYDKKINGDEYYITQNISKCIEISDIHFNNPDSEYKDFIELKKQIVQYVSLILHPGIINPTAIERVMQIALTAKLNSGCISRQVGAVITDDSFSIKAIGWNNVPSGQIPCLLRNFTDLINRTDEKAYSEYELKDEKYRSEIRPIYNEIREKNKENNLIKGRNFSYCFKDIQNRVELGKNQVYTRSLHAEENAFLQITKYGGQGIKGGKLFSTASPCDLCAKKAYQLGIEEIYYIDPYPGIARSNIINSGYRPPKMILFKGAIGRAYFQLYTPILPYKDELAELLEIELPQKTISIEAYHDLEERYKILERKYKEINKI